jgi:Flp pilus assembly pilin Flp
MFVKTFPEADRSIGRRLARIRERGQAATEYILIIGLVVVPMAIAFNRIAGYVKDALLRIAKLFWGPGI